MRNVLKIVASIKRRKRQVMVCPKCRSVDIRRSGSLIGFLFPTRFLCRSCGYYGHFIVELETGLGRKPSSDRE